jgi:hypothetical protein
LHRRLDPVLHLGNIRKNDKLVQIARQIFVLDRRRDQPPQIPLPISLHHKPGPAVPTTRSTPVFVPRTERHLRRQVPEAVVRPQAGVLSHHRHGDFPRFGHHQATLLALAPAGHDPLSRHDVFEVGVLAPQANRSDRGLEHYFFVQFDDGDVAVARILLVVGVRDDFEGGADDGAGGGPTGDVRTAQDEQDVFLVDQGGPEVPHAVGGCLTTIICCMALQQVHNKKANTNWYYL